MTQACTPRVCGWVPCYCTTACYCSSDWLLTLGLPPACPPACPHAPAFSPACLPACLPAGKTKDTLVRFKDIAGMDYLVTEMKEVVKLLLLDPAYVKVGAKCPRVSKG